MNKKEWIQLAMMPKSFGNDFGKTLEFVPAKLKMVHAFVRKLEEECPSFFDKIEMTQGSLFPSDDGTREEHEEPTNESLVPNKKRGKRNKMKKLVNKLESLVPGDSFTIKEEEVTKFIKDRPSTYIGGLARRRGMKVTVKSFSDKIFIVRIS